MMSNLTITIDEDALRRARIRALEQGTSVNAVLRDFLESYAGVRGEQESAVRELLALARSAGAGRGGHRWTREDLHERS
jgi:plasmid stability protein